MNVTALATGIGSVFLFICFLLFSCFNYKNKFKADYDFRNHFPYELNYNLKFTDNFLGNLCLVLSLLSSIFFFVFFNQDHSNGLLIFSLVSGIMVAIDIGAMIFVPLKYLRSHMALDVFLFAFTFMIPCAGAVSGLFAYNNDHTKIATLVITILLFALTLFLFVIIMNPKLSKWTKMDSVTSEDGTISYVRPKFFVLAFSEWILIFSYFVSQILLLLLVCL